jgi:hypothetical protein
MLPDLLRRIVVTKYVLQRASKMQDEGNEVSLSISLLLMHDAVEMLMIAVPDLSQLFDERCQVLKPHLQRSIVASEGTCDVFCQYHVVSVRMPRTKGNKIAGIELVSRPVALDRERTLPSSGKDEVDLMSAFVSPVANFAALQVGHHLVEHEVLP